MKNKTQIVGILNVTPDSFSDGNPFFSAENILLRAEALIASGADWIDVGAESTRPGAIPLSAEEEWSRLEPVLNDLIVLCHRHGRKISLDTYHPETASKSIVHGIDMLNDVGGLSMEGMLQVLSASKVPVVCMHAVSIPADVTRTVDASEDIVESVKNFFEQRIADAVHAGIERERIICDPGIGFGKSALQSLELIRRWKELKQLDRPVYIGHSRKSFLRLFTDDLAHDRDNLTLAFSSRLLSEEVDFLRVHDVSRHVTLRDLLEK